MKEIEKLRNFYAACAALDKDYERNYGACISAKSFAKDIICAALDCRRSEALSALESADEIKNIGEYKNSIWRARKAARRLMSEPDTITERDEGEDLFLALISLTTNGRVLKEIAMLF